MYVYVISSNKNKHLAEDLLKDISNVKFITSEPMIGELVHNAERTRKYIYSSDVIIALIDDEISTHLKNELQVALSTSNKFGKLFIPVLLNGAPILDELKHIQHLYINTSADADLSQARDKLAHVFLMNNDRKRYAHSKPLHLLLITIAIEVICVFFFVMFYFNSKQFGNDSLDIVLSTMSALLAIMTLVISYISIMKRRHQEDNEEEIEFYSRRLKSAIVSVTETEKNKTGEKSTKENQQNIDALGRMLINLEDIKEFYTWSQKQAKASFILAVVMCALGFLLMCAAVILPVAFHLQLQMSIIPAIGGVITELVAGTALIVYKTSLKQLNHYHKALHEDERFLSSVNLIGKFNNLETQDEVLREIIRSEIQMNLVSVKADNNENQTDEI